MTIPSNAGPFHRSVKIMSLMFSEPVSADRISSSCRPEALLGLFIFARPISVVLARWSRDPELLHFCNQSSSLQSEPRGRAPGSSDNPTCRMECLQDKGSFGIHQSALCRSQRDRILD